MISVGVGVKQQQEDEGDEDFGNINIDDLEEKRALKNFGGKQVITTQKNQILIY
jgi:hypothetical protein